MCNLFRVPVTNAGCSEPDRFTMVLVDVSLKMAELPLVKARTAAIEPVRRNQVPEVGRAVAIPQQFRLNSQWLRGQRRSR